MSSPEKLIVVVDDDFDSLEIMKQILETAGYETHCFVDPMEALEEMAVRKPGLVITDLMMRSLDTGFAFSRQIKFDPRFRDIPIILVTAAMAQKKYAVHAETAEDLKKMGIDAFFDKPVEPETLIKKIRELLGGKKGNETDERREDANSGR